MSNDVTTRKSPVDLLKNAMASPSVQEQFKNALAEKKDVFVASLIDLYSGDSYLQNCNPNLVIMEALKAATLNLPINKSLGFAYIVPYKGKPTMQIGYKGLIQLAMRTGQYKHINSDMVYEGEFQSRRKLTGEVYLDGEKESEEIAGFFAHIELMNGFSKTLYWTKKEMDTYAKKYSASFSKGPWQTEYEKMACKTILSSLLRHYGFLSTEMIFAVENDKSEVDYQGNANFEVDVNANKQEIDIPPNYQTDQEETPQEEPLNETPPEEPGF